ncbi:MAG: hypothetical protein NTU81_01130 [Candidatus Nomurabacteria bacterium]|nr:hypothetical protein [Candidatus Nomurabacteria bacterium]
MNKDIKCKECLINMRQIGPFAGVMLEGQSAKKWDGFFNFECINQKCGNMGKLIKLKDNFYGKQ